MPFPMQQPAVAFDAGRCPLCGAVNRCAMEAARAASQAAKPADCWCMVTAIAPAVLARIPAAQRGQACICARCARGEAGG